MDQYSSFDSQSYNGNPSGPNGDERGGKRRNYKLTQDPLLKSGAQKVYRFDGHNPGDPMPVIPRDPRSRMKRFWTKRESIHLPVPKFKYDQYYVGTILPKEVTFTNLNDNIQQQFLRDMCSRYGNIEECKIFYHPVTKKHLSLAKVLFTSTRAARNCVNSLDNTSKMGNIMTVFLDSMGKERGRLLEELTGESMAPAPPMIAPSPPKPKSRHHQHKRALHNDLPPDLPPQPTAIPLTPPLKPPQPPPPNIFRDFPPPPLMGAEPPPGIPLNMRPDLAPNTPQTPLTPFPPPPSEFNPLVPPPGHPAAPPPPLPPQPPPQPPTFNLDCQPPPPQHRGSTYRNSGYEYGESSHRKERQRDRHRGGRHYEEDVYEDGEVDEEEEEGSDDHHRSGRSGYSRSNYERSRDKYYEEDEGSDDDGSRSWERHSRHRRHRRKDRRSDRHRHRRHRYEDEERSSSIREDDYETVSENSNLAGDDTSTPPPQPQAKSQSPEPESRHMSLESRIQSLLRNTAAEAAAVGPHGYDDESANMEAPPQPPLPFEANPPLPMDSAPPLPLDHGPPLPPSEDAPPLPPEPAPPDEALLASHESSQCSNVDSPWIIPPPPQNGDDDHMSLSSLSSGEEHQPVIQMNVPQDQVANARFMFNAHNFQNNALSGGFTNFAKEKMHLQQQLAVPQQEQDEEKAFMKVLDQITTELKHIMRRDLQRKMVESSGFRSFESWWTTEDGREKKQQQLLQSKMLSPPIKLEADKPLLPAALNPLIEQTKPEIQETPNDSMKKETKDMSHTLAGLFDQKDGSMGGFGMGGLLGIRGGISKLPSFRKPKFRPTTPLPVEEDEEYDDKVRKEEDDSQSFKGPRTPEESENEAKDSSSDEGSDAESMGASRKKGSLDSNDSESEEEDSDESSVSSSSESDSDLESDASDVSASSSSTASSEDESGKASIDKSKPIYTSDESDDEKEKGDNRALVEPMSVESSESEMIDVDKTPEKSEASSDEKEVGVKSVEEEEKKKKEEEEMDVSKEGEKVADKETVPLPKLVSPAKSEPAKEPKVEEEAAALALLQMQNQQPKEPEKIEKPKRPEQTAAQIAMAAEHNYHAPIQDSPPQNASPTAKLSSDSTDSASEGEGSLVHTLPPEISIDHGYCQPFFPTEDRQTTEAEAEENLGIVAAEVEIQEDKPKKAVKRPRGGKKLADVTNLGMPREILGLLPPAVERKPVPKFKPRSLEGEMQVTYEFLFKGIDVEDVDFIKKRYEELLGNDSPQTYWLNDTHWVDHSHTRIPDPVPPKKRKKYSQQDEVMVAHKTGCARTEGYYKISHQEKHGYLKDFRGVVRTKEEEAKERDARDAALKKKVQISREARSESRRWQNVLQLMGEDIGDLLKFNQLKFRKKNLKFAKSGIHDWGLFALEPIAEGEMVIEYVGAVVRQSTADLREKKYEAMGIGSSYLFRIDHDTIIDATKCGNLARFINHSCNPNCVAKIISVESHKKIVIYSRRDIGVNEEITYDYKFPLEDEKIPCLCGTSTCRGTLN